jgi:uncharacterized protein (TIGR02271 family)
MDESRDREAIPLAEETLVVGKRQVADGRVRVRTHVSEHTELAALDLTHEEVTVERVPIDREVATAPGVRHEGDTLVIPVIEETMVLEKRLILREEVRITLHRSTEHVEEPVVLRTVQAVVERENAPDTPASTPGDPR